MSGTFFQNRIRRAYNALADATGHRRLGETDVHADDCLDCDHECAPTEDADVASRLLHMSRIARNLIRESKGLRDRLRDQQYRAKMELREAKRDVRLNVIDVIDVDGVGYNADEVRSFKAGFVEATKLRNRLVELEAAK